MRLERSINSSALKDSFPTKSRRPDGACISRGLTFCEGKWCRWCCVYPIARVPGVACPPVIPQGRASRPWLPKSKLHCPQVIGALNSSTDLLTESDSNRRRPWLRARWTFALANVAALLAVAVGFRLWRLGSLPGVNGDEAWFGVQAMELIAGNEIDWQTPSGNLLPQLFFWPTVGLHLWFEPSLALLRCVAVVSGLAALVVNYMLCRRAFDRLTAVVSTLVLAILPINIAYSRFGWETSQTLLFATLTFYPALLAIREESHRLRWSLLACVGLLLSLLVHPTNIFLAPIVMVAVGYAWRGEIRRQLDPRLAASSTLRKWVAIIVIANIGLYFGGSWIRVALAHAIQPAEWSRFIESVGCLLSGTTVYRFISGGVGAQSYPWHVADALFWVCVAAAVLGFSRSVRRLSDPAARCLAWGWAASMIVFFLVGGAAAVAPHHERYGLWMIGPTTLLLAIGVRWWFAHAHSRRLAPWVWSAAAWMVLLSFHTEYIGHFLATGGTSHHTFHTGRVEPKQKAYELVLRQAVARSSGDDLQAWIVCSEWWSYWPLRYLAAQRPDVHVVMWDDYLAQRQAAGRYDRRRVWFVEFAGSAGLARVRRFIGEANLVAVEMPVSDYRGRHSLYVVEAHRVATDDSTLHEQVANAPMLGNDQ